MIGIFIIDFILILIIIIIITIIRLLLLLLYWEVLTRGGSCWEEIPDQICKRNHSQTFSLSQMNQHQKVYEHLHSLHQNMSAFLGLDPLPSYHWKGTIYSLLLTTLPLVAVFFQPALSVLDFAALFGRNIDDWVVKYCLPTFWLEGRSPILKSDSRQVSDSRQATVRIASEGLPFFMRTRGPTKKSDLQDAAETRKS